MTSQCIARRPGIVQGLPKLELIDTIGRSRSLIYYRAKLDGSEHCIAAEYAPLLATKREADDRLVHTTTRALSRLRLQAANFVAQGQALNAIYRQLPEGSQLPNRLTFLQDSADKLSAWVCFQSTFAFNPLLQFQSFNTRSHRIHASAQFAPILANLLARMHANNQLHLNLDPNALIGQLRADGKLGVALIGALAEEQAFAPLVGSNEGLGSAPYSPPELYDGRRDLPVDVRSDIYSASAVIYQVLTGEPPEDWRSDPDHAQNLVRLGADPRSNRVLALVKGLSRKADDRFDSIADWSKAMGFPGDPTASSLTFVMPSTPPGGEEQNAEPETRPSDTKVGRTLAAIGLGMISVTLLAVGLTSDPPKVEVPEAAVLEDAAPAEEASAAATDAAMPDDAASDAAADAMVEDLSIWQIGTTENTVDVSVLLGRFTTGDPKKCDNPTEFSLGLNAQRSIAMKLPLDSGNVTVILDWTGQVNAAIPSNKVKLATHQEFSNMTFEVERGQKPDGTRADIPGITPDKILGLKGAIRKFSFSKWGPNWFYMRYGNSSHVETFRRCSTEVLNIRQFDVAAE